MRLSIVLPAIWLLPSLGIAAAIPTVTKTVSSTITSTLTKTGTVTSTITSTRTITQTAAATTKIVTPAPVTTTQKGPTSTITSVSTSTSVVTTVTTSTTTKQFTSVVSTDTTTIHDTITSTATRYTPITASTCSGGGGGSNPSGSSGGGDGGTGGTPTSPGGGGGGASSTSSSAPASSTSCVPWIDVVFDNVQGYSWEGAHLVVYEPLSQSDPYTASWGSAPDQLSSLLLDQSTGFLYNTAVFDTKAMYYPNDDWGAPHVIEFATPDMIKRLPDLKPITCELPGIQNPVGGERTVLKCNAEGATSFVAPVGNYQNDLSLASFVGEYQINPDLDATVMGCGSVPKGFSS